MPPEAQVIVRQANGQTLVLSGDDRIVKEVTIPCSSQRCASRHGQPGPVTFTFNDQDPFPESGDQFMSLITPERSPSNLGFPLPFCGPGCLKDYLTYQYFAPSPRAPEPVREADLLEAESVINAVNAPQHPDCGISCVEAESPEDMADVEASVGSHDLPEPTVIGQADGVGE